MGIRNLNWYNLQSTRRYPLDDFCTGEDDAGQSLLNDILVDCHLRFPRTLGTYAYLQAVTVSDGLVTLIIGAGDNLQSAGNIIAAVTVAKPVEINVNIAVTPMTAGVAGWVVLGAGINNGNFFARFSTLRQSLLSARCARSYAPLPIPEMNKQYVVPALQGIVNFIAETPLRLDYKVDNGRPLIVFGLDRLDSSLSYNPLEYFLGPCTQRPESDTCGKTPISTINGVRPDCTGNIKIRFENVEGKAFKDCGGIDIVTDSGLKEACQGPPPLPPFYSDLCCPRRFDTVEERDAALIAALDTPETVDNFSVGDIVRVGVASGAGATPYQYYKLVSLQVVGGVWDGPLSDNDEDLKAALAKCDWPNPTDVIPDVVINLTELENYPLIALPACIDFCSCDPDPPLFEVVQGVFTAKKTKAPFGCVPCSTGSAPPDTQTGRFELKLRNTYYSIDSGGVALSMLKNAATDWAFGRAISTQLKIDSTGLDRNGGVVINYRKVSVGGVLQTRYFVAVLDVSKGQLRLLDYTNNSYIVLASVPFRVQTNKWYTLSVYPAIRGEYVYINVVAEEMRVDGLRAEIIDYRLRLEEYEPQTGAFGLYTQRSYTFFNAFTIT